MNPFPGAPAFNTIDYFAIVFLFSLLAVPLSYVSRNRLFQNLLHICLGSLCLFSVAPRLLFFYLVFWLLVYLFTLAARLQVPGILAYAKVFLPIVVILSPMVYWKLDHLAVERFLNLDLHTFIWNHWRAGGEVDAIYKLVAPLGLSFSVFRAIDLIAEVNIGIVEKPSFPSVLAYGLFAPVQIVGPIIQYRELNRAFGDPGERSELTRWGFLQIVVGMGKAFVLAWPLSWSASIVTVFPDQTVHVIWLSIAVFPVYLFLNFSGFSDMSIGMAAIFGYRLEPNFNNPLLRPSLQQFWNNWHMSLTRFAQRNIFVPLGGYRKETQYFALFCTMMVIALWHDLSIALALFGALHGTAMVIGRMIAAKNNPSGRATVAKSGRDNWGRWAVGWARTYLFLILTVPLLVVRDGDIVRFYASLLGVRY